MNMLRIINNQITYPYSIGHLRRDNPSVSFPREMSVERMTEWGVYPVSPTPQPEHDGMTQNLEEGTPVLVNGEWVQVWNVTNATEEQIAQRQEANVPDSVTRRQARQALILAGKFNLVQPAIDAIQDPTQRALMQSEWDDSQVFERNRPALIQMTQALGMTSQQVDALFITAASL